jgi:hypothetical protein
MNEIHFRIIQNVFVVLMTFLNIIFISDLVQGFFSPLTDGIHVCLWMALIYGDEFGTEPEPYDGDVILFAHIV